MNNHQIRWACLLGTLVLAGVFCLLSFHVTWGSFWLKISLSAAVLASLSLRLRPDMIQELRFDTRAVAIGFVSAAVLYLIFAAGKGLITMVLPFAGDQIEQIYLKGRGTPGWEMAALSFFVTGPSEELFWRGYVQHQLMQYLGEWQGWLMATTVYAGIHFWSFNFTLVIAAMVAGAFWGGIYWRFKNLSPVIVAHSIWSVTVFALLPFG